MLRRLSLVKVPVYPVHARCVPYAYASYNSGRTNLYIFYIKSRGILLPTETANSHPDAHGELSPLRGCGWSCARARRRKR